MVNLTTAPGGGTLANGVVTYLPECSALRFDDVVFNNAESFDLTDSTYYVDLIPSVVPGLLFAILSLPGFLLFSIWLCMQCGGQPPRRHTAPGQAQFIGSSKQTALPPGAPPPATAPRRSRRGLACKVALLLAALALAGLSGWGMAQSIQATDSTVSDFWGIVEQVEGKVSTAADDLELLGTQLAQLSGNVSTVSDRGPALLELFDSALDLLTGSQLAGLLTPPGPPAASPPAPTPAGPLLAAVNASEVRDALAAAVDSLVALPDDIDGLEDGITDAVQLLRDSFNDTLADIRSRFEAPTLAVEQRWRFIPIAVAFGTTILAALVCAASFWSLRWYRSAVAALALLWLDLALLWLLGVGLIRFVSVLASDSCLYSEFLSLDLVQRKVAASQRDRVLSILSYAYGLIDIPDSQVVDQLLGVPTWRLHDAVYGPFLPLATQLTQMADTPQVGALVAGGGCDGCLAALANLTAILPNVSATVWRLEQQALRPSIQPLYHQVKGYLCCGLSGAAADIWVAWTCAGVVGFVLGLLCTARIAHHTLSLRKYERRLAAAAAAAVPDKVCWQGAAHTPPTSEGKGGLELEAGYTGQPFSAAAPELALAPPAAGFGGQGGAAAAPTAASGVTQHLFWPWGRHTSRPAPPR